jgi:capsular exopolysaccharide synthesis family protein
MGKVYDALQRAEEQRARRVGESGAGAAAIQRASMERAGAPSIASKRRFLGGFLQRRTAPREEDASTLNKRRIAMLQPQSFVTEQFRTLRARLETIAPRSALRTICVTSATPGEGKTTAAVNLALVMSMSVGQRILLVDCDLRMPRIHESLGLRVDAGLAEVLRGDAQLDEAIVGVDGSQLRVLPVRDLPPNPAELLGSARMRELVEKLATDYDRVIFDAPPTLGLPDAKVMCDLAEGVLFVIRAHATPQDEVAAALQIIGRERLLGMVLNESDANPSRYGYEG